MALQELPPHARHCMVIPLVGIRGFTHAYARDLYYLRIAAALPLFSFKGGEISFFFSLFFLPLVVFVFFVSFVVPAGSRLSFSLRFVVGLAV